MGCYLHPFALACSYTQGSYITLKQCYRVLLGCSRCESQQQQVLLSLLTPSRLAATPHKFNLSPLEHQLKKIFFYITKTVSVHQIMNVDSKWNCLTPILSSLVKYSGLKHHITTTVTIESGVKSQPYLDSFQSIYSKLQQIMNVHIKRNCLIPIWSSLVQYYWFQA